MSEKNISGRDISLQIKEELKQEVAELKTRGVIPGLTVILVGENPASQVYVRNKEKTANEAGFKSEVIRYPVSISEQELLRKIDELNEDDSVNGFFVQLPVPAHIDDKKIINAIKPDKDVDGFHPENMGKLVYGDTNGLYPATPSGIMEMLDRENIDVSGKNVVIVGRSNIVGKPMLHMMLKKNATVTICHSKTQNLASVCSEADILVAAIGRAKMFTSEYVKDGAIVIDVGMNRDENDKLCGDVDYDSVINKVSRITPVPRGVGPMTIAMLMKNTIKAAKIQNNIK